MDNGCAIVAEASADPAFYGEIYLGVEDPHGAWLQDLAIVRGAYRYDDQLQRAVYDGEKYDVLVYGDPTSEDFTDVFEIYKVDDDSLSEALELAITELEWVETEPVDVSSDDETYKGEEFK